MLLLVFQADALQKQLDRKIAEFKAQETEREKQKKQLTSVVEELLRKASLGEFPSQSHGDRSG